MVGGKLLGKTMKFVSGVLFSRDARDGSPESEKMKGKEREAERNRDIDFKEMRRREVQGVWEGTTKVVADGGSWVGCGYGADEANESYTNIWVRFDEGRFMIVEYGVSNWGRPKRHR